MFRSILIQIVLGTVVVAAATVIWAVYVPSSHPMLAKWGVLQRLEALGIVATPDNAASAVRGGGAPGGFGRGAVTVVAAPHGEALANDSVAAIGTGQALRSVIVVPESSGRLTEVAITSGAQVAQGMVLARLDSEAEEIARTRAELVLADARDRAARVARLQSSGTATDIQIREAELAVRQAELALRQAVFDLGRREIRAPIAGWVGLLALEPGKQVNAQTEVARIDDRSAILVEFRVPERFVGQIALGDEVQAQPLSQSDVTLTGVVNALDNRVDETSRTLRVQARLDNSGDLLRAGMSFAISLSVGGDSFPTVDPLAVQWGSDGAFVWVVRDGKAQRVPIRIVQRRSTEVLVTASFLPGDQVVSEGVLSLRPGAEVQLRVADPDGVTGGGRKEGRGLVPEASRASPDTSKI